MLQLPAWKPTLSVGNPQIDAQHQHLLALGGQALTLLHTGDTAPGDFPRLLTDIAQATAEHFEFEEGVLERNHCPTLPAHRQEHAAYMERLADILGLEFEGITDKRRLATLIHELITTHVVETDLPNAAYMAQPAAEPR